MGNFVDGMVMCVGDDTSNTSGVQSHVPRNACNAIYHGLIIYLYKLKTYLSFTIQYISEIHVYVCNTIMINHVMFPVAIILF